MHEKGTKRSDAEPAGKQEDRVPCHFLERKSVAERTADAERCARALLVQQFGHVPHAAHAQFKRSVISREVGRRDRHFSCAWNGDLNELTGNET